MPGPQIVSIKQYFLKVIQIKTTENQKEKNTYILTYVIHIYVCMYVYASMQL